MFTSKTKRHVLLTLESLACATRVLRSHVHCVLARYVSVAPNTCAQHAATLFLRALLKKKPETNKRQIPLLVSAERWKQNHEKYL